ncbi:MAG: hypothetical protein JOZ51_29090 [Chloroflexi bacterium]|nr:hypothetical protein [Chloroflexota bacterium]
MSLRRIITLAILSGIVGLSGSVEAAPARSTVTPSGAQLSSRVMYETLFYSDASYTVQVGYLWGNQCSGDRYQSGQETPYQINHWEPCE